MSNFSKSEKEIYELRKQKIAFLNDISNDSFPTKFNESTNQVELEPIGQAFYEPANQVKQDRSAITCSFMYVSVQKNVPF